VIRRSSCLMFEQTERGGSIRNVMLYFFVTTDLPFLLHIN